MASTDAALARIAREFQPRDQDLARNLILRYLHDAPESAEHTWELVLDLARGDLDALRWLVGRSLPEEWDDFRDQIVSRDAWRTLAQLVATGGRGSPFSRNYVEEIRREYVRNRERAARFFPAGQVDEVVLWMGLSWPSNAEEILVLARGDVDRFRGILFARPAGTLDPSIPAPLAELPYAAAELIRRDFAPERWDAAAQAAAGAPPMRGVGGALGWLLATEYAAGDVDDLAASVRMLRENEPELYRGIGRRRAERRAAAEE